MHVEIREFPQGMDLADHAAGRSADDPSVVKQHARRSWVLIDGRCVAHIGWSAGDLVFIQPVTEQEVQAAIAKCRQEFDCEITDQMASPSFAEPADRRRKRRQIPGKIEDDE